MNHRQVEKVARELEAVADVSTQALAEELHKMSPRERMAIARQIEEDAREHASPLLPKLEFTSSGDLKTSDEIVLTEKGVVRLHAEFNPATGKALHAERSELSTVPNEIIGDVARFPNGITYDRSTNKIYIPEKDAKDFREDKLYDEKGHIVAVRGFGAHDRLLYSQDQKGFYVPVDGGVLTEKPDGSINFAPRHEEHQRPPELR